MRLEKVFKEFIDFRILKWEYDVINGVVLIEIRNPEVDQFHTIVLRNVSLCFHLQNIDNIFILDTFNELSSIAIVEDRILTKGIKQKWLKSYPMDFNIVVENIRSTMIIKAEMIELGDVRYDLINKRIL